MTNNSDVMTQKERWLAAIKLQPIDRLVFWPKLFNEAYANNQKPPFNKMSIPELHDWIGSDNQVGVPKYVKMTFKSSGYQQIDQGDTRKITYSTRYGSTERILKFDPVTSSWHPVKMAIENINDLRIMTEWFKDCEPVLDKDKLDKAKAFALKTGDRALVADTIGESPLMDYIEWLAGVENGHFMLFDYPYEVEELLAVMHKRLLRMTEISTEFTPADVLYFTENTSTTLISVDQFKKYCFRHLQDYAEIIKGAGKLFCIHMCGHLKDILPDLSKLDADSFEAFTSPTLGNTTLLDGRTACPGKCFIGGTNAILWTRSAKEIINQIELDLNSLPHHRGIVVSSAGVMTPICEPETIKEVCNWVKSYKLK